MINTIYVEEGIRNHPRVAKIMAKIKSAEIIYCDHYREVFNINAQNFRQQKQNPSLILAYKPKNYVHPCPQGYGVGGKNNYYFSHMLNCVYDCRYCFLQGMYRSAHYVVFVNYEDFDAQIRQYVEDYHQNPQPSFNHLANSSLQLTDSNKRASKEFNAPSAHDLWFFSGYDCDSLVFEPWTGFIEHQLKMFENLPAYLELRTKSTQITPLIKRPVLDNVVVAFSFTSSKLHQRFEDKVPSIEKRIDAMKKLADLGWKLGLRLDPLIWFDGYLDDFHRLVEQIMNKVDSRAIHSVTIGGFRLPKSFYQNLKSMYPDNVLFSQYFEEIDGMIAFPANKEIEMLEKTKYILSNHLNNNVIYTMS